MEKEWRALMDKTEVEIENVMEILSQQALVLLENRIDPNEDPGMIQALKEAESKRKAIIKKRETFMNQTDTGHIWLYLRK